MKLNVYSIESVLKNFLYHLKEAQSHANLQIFKKNTDTTVIMIDIKRYRTLCLMQLNRDGFCGISISITPIFEDGMHIRGNVHLHKNELHDIIMALEEKYGDVLPDCIYNTESILGNYRHDSKFIQNKRNPDLMVFKPVDDKFEVIEHSFDLHDIYKRNNLWPNVIHES